MTPPAAGTRCATNCRPTRCQSNARARARARSRGTCSARRAARCRSVSSTPPSESPTTSSGPAHRKRRHRCAAGQGLEHDEAEGVGAARVDEGIGGAVQVDQAVPRQRAEPVHAGPGATQAFEQRAAAAHQLGARQLEAQECFEVLLARDAADIEEHRLWQCQRSARPRLEQLQVDAVRPAPQPGEAVLLEDRHGPCGRHHHARRCRMEAAQRGIAEARRQAGRGGDEFGEPGVEGGRETQAAAAAVGARGMAERAFGGDVDGLGRQGIEQLLEPLARPPGQLDLDVARAADPAKKRRLDDDDLVPGALQLLQQVDQDGDHAVHLRCPGIADDGDLHGSGATRSHMPTGATAARCVSPRPPCRCRADQSMSSSRPSACSASAVRLSTQSPSLA